MSRFPLDRLRTRINRMRTPRPQRPRSACKRASGHELRRNASPPGRRNSYPLARLPDVLPRPEQVRNPPNQAIAGTAEPSRFSPPEAVAWLNGVTQRSCLIRSCSTNCSGSRNWKASMARFLAASTLTAWSSTNSASPAAAPALSRASM